MSEVPERIKPGTLKEVLKEIKNEAAKQSTKRT